MSGTIVTVRNIDSVRVDVLGGSRALTVPASLILDIDCVLRFCAMEDEELELTPVQDDDSGNEFWECRAGNHLGSGVTPWASVADLAKTIERESVH